MLKKLIWEYILPYQRKYIHKQRTTWNFVRTKELPNWDQHLSVSLVFLHTSGINRSSFIFTNHLVSYGSNQDQDNKLLYK